MDHRALSQALRQRLPEYMIPKYLDAIQELPRLTSGKLDRHQLPPSTTLLASSERESVRAETALERDMVEVFQTCLGVSPIFVGDDFFTDLGGHSLLAARVVTALRSRFTPRASACATSMNTAPSVNSANSLGSDGTVVDDAPASPPVQAIPPGRGHVSGACRWLCATLQAVALLAYHAVIAGPTAVLFLMSAMAFRGEIDLWDAVAIMSTVSVLTWPCWLALSIVLKWLVIGRVQAGAVSLVGVGSLPVVAGQPISGPALAGMFVGTPPMSLDYRAMGAKVGRNSTIGTPLCMPSMSFRSAWTPASERKRSCWATASRTAGSSSVPSPSVIIASSEHTAIWR